MLRLSGFGSLFGREALSRHTAASSSSRRVKPAKSNASRRDFNRRRPTRAAWPGILRQALQPLGFDAAHVTDACPALRSLIDHGGGETSVDGCGPDPGRLEARQELVDTRSSLQLQRSIDIEQPVPDRKASGPLRRRGSPVVLAERAGRAVSDVRGHHDDRRPGLRRSFLRTRAPVASRSCRAWRCRAGTGPAETRRRASAKGRSARIARGQDREAERLQRKRA